MNNTCAEEIRNVSSDVWFCGCIIMKELKQGKEIQDKCSRAILHGREKNVKNKYLHIELFLWCFQGSIKWGIQFKKRNWKKIGFSGKNTDFCNWWIETCSFGKKIKTCLCNIFYITEKTFDEFYDVTSYWHYSGSFKKRKISIYQCGYKVGLNSKKSKKARNSVTKKMTKVRYFKIFQVFFFKIKCV